MKELCKILDRVQERLQELFGRIDRVEKLQQAGQYFGGGQAQPSSEQPQAQGPVQAPAPPAEPVRRPGPHIMRGMDDVFEGHEKQASERKRKDFADERDFEAADFAAIKKIVEEVFNEEHAYDVGDIELSPLRPSNKAPKPMSWTDAKAEFEKMQKDFMDKAKEDLDKSKEEMKNDFARQAFGLLSNVFGRRLVNMLTPDKLHGGDWLFLGQNLRWMDGKVRNTINKSLSEKVASGAMTEAEANAAGGFATTEAVGAQAAGGVLMGLFIAQHIPEIVRYLKDSVDFIDLMKTTFTGDKGFENLIGLQKASAHIDALKPAWDKVNEYAQSRVAVGAGEDLDANAAYFAKQEQIIANDKRLKSAVDAWLERRAPFAASRTAAHSVGSWFRELFKAK